MLQDTLADALSVIKNADKIGKKECVTQASKEIRSVLKVLQNHDYIGTFEFVNDGKSGKFKVELKGKIIDCNVIKPRFPIRVDDYEKFEKQYLPAREMGILIVSTPKGIIDHRKAQELHTGGRLLAFCY